VDAMVFRERNFGVTRHLPPLAGSTMDHFFLAGHDHAQARDLPHE